MSTDWDMHCIDCDSNHGFYDANHEEEAVARIVALLPRFAAMPGLAALFKEAGFMPIGIGDDKGLYKQGLNLEWIEKHASHNVLPRNEYGDYLDSCSAYVPCSCCGENFRCRLPIGHKEDHASKRTGENAVHPSPPEPT